jgi:hypothetical protein
MPMHNGSTIPQQRRSISWFFHFEPVKKKEEQEEEEKEKEKKESMR